MIVKKFCGLNENNIKQYCAKLDEDDNYKFHGNIINHPKYGEQFNCTFYERVILHCIMYYIFFIHSSVDSMS